MPDEIIVKVSVAGPSLLADHIAAVPVRKRAVRLATLAAIGLAIETGKGAPTRDFVIAAPVPGPSPATVASSGPASPPPEPAASFDSSMLDSLIGLGVGGDQT